MLGAFGFDIDEVPFEEDEVSRKARGFGRRVEGTGETRPIVLITSNREKQLPEPFLRRCLYIELKFPEDPSVLATIVKKNLGADATKVTDKLLRAAVTKFVDIRKKAQAAGAQKPPATSELIDWVKVLLWKEETADTVNAAEAPYVRILFKTMQDLDLSSRQPK